MGSDLGRVTGYPDGSSSWVFSVPAGKYRDRTVIRPRPLPSASFPVRIYWVYGLCPSLGILKDTGEHNVPETGSFCVLK
jgi:hypothetical protein